MNALLLTALLISAPPNPPSAFAPTLHVRVIAPAGVRVTWRPGTGDARSVEGPVGLRPGYIHRLRLEGFEDDPTTAFDPSIEVRSTLFMPMNLKPEDYPATLTINVDDLRRALAGGIVTKVIYLENPLDAPPETTTPDRPLETDVHRGEDPLEEAHKRGRPLAIVRIGGRTLTQAELIQWDVPGAMNYPGQPLAPPAYPPMLPMRQFKLFDPILGPRIPTEELLPDGGDIGPRIGIGPGGHLGNVEPTDTAAEYRIGDRKRAVISNRVCLFAPRMPMMRQELAIGGVGVSLPPGTAEQAVGASLTRVNRPAWETEAITSVAAMKAREQLRGVINRTGWHELESYQGGPLVLGTVEGLRVKATVVEPLGMTQYRDQCKPDEPLVLIKTLDPREAQPGDVVTFTIKFVNYGSRPAKDVVVADSLASRLEYVGGSSRGDRPTTFTMQLNASGSMILRWEIVGDIPAGQSGIVQFQAKVR
jgi:uncharacterized repeat protein (TIGR01451 family)